MHLSSGTRRSLATIGAAGALVAAGVVATPPAQAAGQITVALRDGVLYVAGNATANKIRIAKASDGRIAVIADSRIERRGAVPTVRNVRAIRVSVGAGNDVVDVRPGLPGATVLLGDGHDYGYGGSGDDVVRGGNGNDAVSGREGDDLVLGDAGNDTVIGGAGFDRLQGNAGSDDLSPRSGLAHGGTGDDRYALHAIFGSNVYLHEDPGGGVDTVAFSSLRHVDDTLGVPVTFSLASATTQQASESLRVRLSASDTFENLLGGQGHDVLTGNALANRISGSWGDDQLEGGGGADAFLAGDDQGVWDVASDGLIAAWFGRDTIGDFGIADVVEMTPSGVVTEGLGTDTVRIDADWDFGYLTATGHTFTAEDFG